MTTSEPDPRTDLAGWLGLKPAQVSRCRSEVEAGDGTVAAAVGRRIIAQDQADTPDPEPDEGLIAVTVRLTAQEVAGEGEGWDTAVDKLCDACAAIDLPTPQPPWTSPLPNLPDLTEQQCRGAVLAAEGYPDSDMPWPQIGRALIAAGWTPEEADRG